MTIFGSFDLQPQWDILVFEMNVFKDFYARNVKLAGRELPSKAGVGNYFRPRATLLLY